MVEAGKNIWPPRTPSEEAARYNSLPRDEKVRRLLARCGFAEDAAELALDMEESGALATDSELALYSGHPVAQARILLHRRAEDLWKDEETHADLVTQGISHVIITPEQWARHYLGQFEDVLYLDLPA